MLGLDSPELSRRDCVAAVICDGLYTCERRFAPGSPALGLAAPELSFGLASPELSSVAAVHAGLCAFQSVRWHSREQYRTT